ncbi:hypothetical protein KOW79_007145 [Hemibagrus wyckioides]|uniref:Uncharacterized protein n=1 Tax=Hemibagrus wyckioides TaxID=337641 RepID=A0A9D3SLF3_9TELE|nr:hypothetical protein KOW79_007145 [Hemibagrus wyckioides]
MFGDTKCDELHYFICHITHPVREQQIMRLQIKSDDSVSDSAMQSTILDLIMKKLEEHGMLKNTTVTWRVLSNAPPVREKQILRIQVKSDLSIFDSGVQSAILELVKQKLDENSMMENTTVAWRVKSDGQIFYKKNN